MSEIGAPATPRVLADLPKDWTVLPLKRLVSCKITDGPHETPEFVDAGVPFISAEGVHGGSVNFEDMRGYITPEADRIYSRKCKPRRGDILLCKAGATTGKSAFVDTDDNFNIWSPLALIRASESLIVPRLLYLQLSSGLVQEQIGQFSNINTQPNIGMGDIENLLFAVPPRPRQLLIAEFLDRKTRAIDELIRKQERVVRLLQEEREALVARSAELEDTRLLRLGAVSDQMYRPIARQDDELYRAVGLFNRGRGIFHKEPTLGAELGDSTFFWIQEDDLILSGQFAWEGAVGLAGKEDAGCIASHRYPIVRARPDLANSAYLLAFFKSPRGQFLLNENSRGAAGRNRPLNAAMLMKEKIPVPLLHEQKRIATLVYREKHLSRILKREFKRLREYRHALISAAVTGHIDVTEEAGS